MTRRIRIQTMRLYLVVDNDTEQTILATTDLTTAQRTANTTEPPTQPCPECVQGRHDNCDTTAWETITDTPTACPCWVDNHQGGGG